MAQGISEMRSTRAYEVSTGCPFLKDFLDRFFLARIGIRVLACMLMTMVRQLMFPAL